MFYLYIYTIGFKKKKLNVDTFFSTGFECVHVAEPVKTSWIHAERHWLHCAATDCFVLFFSCESVLPNCSRNKLTSSRSRSDSHVIVTPAPAPRCHATLCADVCSLLLMLTSPLFSPVSHSLALVHKPSGVLRCVWRPKGFLNFKHFFLWCPLNLFPPFLHNPPQSFVFFTFDNCC